MPVQALLTRPPKPLCASAELEWLSGAGAILPRDKKESDV